MVVIHLSVIPLVINTKRLNLSLYISIPLYFLIQISLYAVAVYRIFVNKYLPASALIVYAEIARMSMKVHAYYREKVLYGIYSDSVYAKFIPKWAANAGV